jgi:hypothetical protein
MAMTLASEESLRQDGEQLVGRRGPVWPCRGLVEATGKAGGCRLAAKGVTPVDENGRRAPEADRVGFLGRLHLAVRQRPLVEAGAAHDFSQAVAARVQFGQPSK